jgi:hypothetical protein
MVVARRADMGDVLFKPYLERVARQLQQQTSHNQLLQRRKVQETRQNQVAWDILQTALPAAINQPTPFDAQGNPEASGIRQLALPSGPHLQVKLTRLRRKRYRHHLQATIAKALTPPTQDAESTAKPEQAAAPTPAPPSANQSALSSALPGHMCAFCGGGCCTLGGDHAYLGVSTLRRFMAQNPGLSAAQVLDAYTSRLPKYNQFGSCINHTAHGCSLSRDMRSDICNNYVCEELGQVEQTLRRQAPLHTILVVRRKLDNWTRAAPGQDNRIVALATITENGISEIGISEIDRTKLRP